MVVIDGLVERIDSFLERRQVAGLQGLCERYVQHDGPSMGVSGGDATITSNATVSGTAYVCSEGEAEAEAPPTEGGESPQVAGASSIVREQTPEGHADLRVTLSFAGAELTLRSVPAEFEHVEVVVQLPSDAVTDDCDVAIAAEAKALPGGPAAIDGVGADRLVRVELSSAAFEELAAATRVLGRACAQEFRLDGGQLAAVRELSMRIRELRALLPKPPEDSVSVPVADSPAEGSARVTSPTQG